MSRKQGYSTEAAIMQQSTAENAEEAIILWFGVVGPLFQCQIAMECGATSRHAHTQPCDALFLLFGVPSHPQNRGAHSGAPLTSCTSVITWYGLGHAVIGPWVWRKISARRAKCRKSEGIAPKRPSHIHHAAINRRKRRRSDQFVVRRRWTLI
jgi:hypothetical protein